MKLAVLWQLADHPLLRPGGGLDSDYYHQLAGRVASGELLLAPGLYFVSPLYIYFLGALLAFGASLFAAKIVQIALGTAACLLVWLTAREWFGERAAWLALCLAALTGVFTFYEVLVLQAAIDPFLTALGLWLLTRALREPRSGERRHARGNPEKEAALPCVLAGAALALHALNRPNMLLVGAGLGLVLLWRTDTRRMVPLVAAGVAVVLLPLSIRNFVAAGTLAPVPSHGGLNLYIGNNPNADGTFHSVEGITPNISGQAIDAKRVAEKATGRSMTDRQVSEYFTGRALGWMKENPGAATRLLLRKVAYALNSTFLTLNYSYPFYRAESAVLGLLAVGPLLLVPLGLTGLWSFSVRGERAPRRYSVFAALVPLHVVSIAIFFVASRYRVPLLLLLCITAGASIDAAIAALGRRRTSAVALAGGAAIGIAVLAGWNFHLDDGRAEEETQMALVLIDQHRWEEAEAYVQRAAAGHAAPARVHRRVGEAYMQNGRRATAIVHLEEAHRSGARSAQSAYDLAVAYAQEGRLADAARTLESIDVRQADRERVAAVADAFSRLGLQLSGSGKLEEGIRAFQNAVRLAPDRAVAHLNLAVAYAESGRREAAEIEARRALALDPEYQRAKDFLAVLTSRD